MIETLEWTAVACVCALAITLTLSWVVYIVKNMGDGGNGW